MTDEVSRLAHPRAAMEVEGDEVEMWRRCPRDCMLGERGGEAEDLCCVVAGLAGEVSPSCGLSCV